VGAVSSSASQAGKNNGQTQRRWATLAEAATYLSCNEKSVRRYISAGLLTGYRVANLRTIRVDLDEIDERLLSPMPATSAPPRPTTRAGRRPPQPTRQRRKAVSSSGVRRGAT
jgi:hypothetical protein